MFLYNLNKIEHINLMISNLIFLVQKYNILKFYNNHLKSQEVHHLILFYCLNNLVNFFQRNIIMFLLVQNYFY